MWDLIRYCSHCGHQLILVNGVDLIFDRLRCPDCGCETLIHPEENNE